MDLRFYQAQIPITETLGFTPKTANNWPLSAYILFFGAENPVFLGLQSLAFPSYIEVSSSDCQRVHKKELAVILYGEVKL